MTQTLARMPQDDLPCHDPAGTASEAPNPLLCAAAPRILQGVDVNRRSLFTANRIAVCLARTPQAIRKALRDVKPSGKIIVTGQEAAAWEFEAMPRTLRAELTAAAERLHYRNPLVLLCNPPSRLQPSVPLNSIADEEIAGAAKLRQAFLPALLNQHTAGLSAAEFETQGVKVYGEVFGRSITCRHWRSIYRRILENDSGAEEFDRLEIYLPANPRLKKNDRLARASSPHELFPEIVDYIFACSNPAAPTEIEQRSVWKLAFERYDRLRSQGINSKKAARQIRDFLFSKASFLAPSRNALRMAFERRLAQWEEKAGDPAALRDRREDNGAGYQLPEVDRDRLIHRAVFQYRGQIAPAWLDLLRDGFSEPVRQRYSRPARKSYVPESVMNSVSPEVEILTVLHQGPRAFDSIKGHVDRCYNGIASLQCLSADDFTMNSYYYVPNGADWFHLTRGQVILFIDFRSLRILGWALEPRASYSSLTIRSLCTHVFGEFGVPDVLQFERGLWKSATLLKGKQAPFSFTEISQGLCEFGIKFIHSIRPRSKTVERVGGLFQEIAEAEPGYCGRNERQDAPESLRKQMAAVEGKKVHPSKYFYSYEQWNHRIGELAAQYNATTQEGKVLAGMSPDQAFELFLDRSNPPKQFTAGLRYLLAHDKRVARVTLNGVTIQVGKQKFNYRGRAIAHLVGREVLAWFDPENPDVLAVTDMNRENPICIERSAEPSALECMIAPGSGSLSRELGRIEDQASYMKTRFNILKAKFPLPERTALTNAQTIELGQQIDAGKSRIRSGQIDKHRNQEAANRLMRQTGITVPGRAIGTTDSEDAKVLKAFLKKEEESAE